jgi:hypothetical protein
VGFSFYSNENFVVNTVDVFLSSSTPGDLVIQLKDVSYNTIDEVTVAVPAGGSNANPVQFTVPLNLNVNAGSSYKLVAVSGPAMIRDLGSNSFPYPIGTAGTITGGTINDGNTNTGVYYFFYNWKVTPVGVCSSPRVEVLVAVNNTPAPTADANQTFMAGETVANLEVSGQNLSWFADPNGTIPMSPDTPLTDGYTYYVNQTINGCPGPIIGITVTQTLAINDNQMPNLSYFPNPVINDFFMTNDEPINLFEVYNLRGQKLISLQLDSTSGAVDLSSLSSGAYLGKIKSGKNQRIVRIIKN